MAEVGDFEAGQQAAIHGLSVPASANILPCTVESGLPESDAKHLLLVVA